MNNEKSHVLLQEVLTQWDEQFTLESIRCFREMTAEDPLRRVQILAELVTVLCSMGQQSVACQLRLEAQEFGVRSAELASWSKLVELNWLVANAQFNKSIELCT